MVRRRWRCLAVAFTVMLLGGGGPARAQVDACALAENVLGQFWRVFNSGFAGVDSCALDLESGGLQITYITIVEHASVVEADAFVATYSPPGAASFGIGDAGTSFSSPNTPTEAHAIVFRQGLFGVSVEDTEDYSFALEVARALEQQLPSGSGSSAEPDGEADPTTGAGSSSSSSSGRSSSDSGIPPEVVIAGTAVLVLTGGAVTTVIAVNQRAKRNGNQRPDNRAQNAEPPECVGILADRAALAAEIEALNAREVGRAAQTRTQTDNRATLDKIERDLAAMSGGLSAPLAGGEVSDVATFIGVSKDGAGMSATYRAGRLAGLPHRDALRSATVVSAKAAAEAAGNAATWTPDYLGAGLGLVGTAANAFGHSREREFQRQAVDLAALEERATFLRLSLIARGKKIDALSEEIDNARRVAEPLISAWNRANEVAGCGGGRLDAARPRPETTGATEQSAAPPTPTEPGCEHLAADIARHNQAVAEAEPPHHRRRERRTDLDGKLAALRAFDHEIALLWLDLRARIRVANSEWELRQIAGHALNITGVTLAWLGTAAPPAAGVGVGMMNLGNSYVNPANGASPAELALGGQYTAIRTRTKAVSSRLGVEAGRVRREIDATAEPLRFRGNELRVRKRQCRFQLSGQSAAPPLIADLSTTNTGESAWVRARAYLPAGAPSAWTRQQIIDFMQRAQAW